ncbi:MAG: hypothetical protein ACFE96_06795, partial [Candidatus Hermodarchaeota archaeon]
MNPDKNQDVLEKQLKTLGQKIRIDILKKLSLSNAPLPYSSLQKEVLGSNPNAINFSFHLKALKNSVLIESSEKGYMLSLLGKQILKNIVSIEQILNAKNKTTMIRTSKYSKEPFDARKIEAYLIKEGQVKKNIAKQITKEVEERLSKTNINYLTAPLMREYINAILLEIGHEEIRHKLTRLGTPPFEVSKKYENSSINPEQFLSKLGSDVSEQFLLLNLLPKKEADLYLSGEVVLLNLNYWSLRPLGFVINTRSIIDYITNCYSISLNKLDQNINKLELMTHFFDILSRFVPFFSEDIFLCDFEESLLSYFNTDQKNSKLLNILVSQILKQTKRQSDSKPHLSLELPNFDSFVDIYLSKLKNLVESVAPLIVYDYNKLTESETGYNVVLQNAELGTCRNFIFYNGNNSNLLNSTRINFNNLNGNNSKDNKIILDKILINLHKIAENSNQNDSTFFEKLQERLGSVFKLFEHKKELVNRKLKSSRHWNRIITEFFVVDKAK